MNLLVKSLNFKNKILIKSSFSSNLKSNMFANKLNLDSFNKNNNLNVTIKKRRWRKRGRGGKGNNKNILNNISKEIINYDVYKKKFRKLFTT